MKKLCLLLIPLVMFFSCASKGDTQTPPEPAPAPPTAAPPATPAPPPPPPPAPPAAQATPPAAPTIDVSGDRNAAASARENALSIRADVAAKPEYDQAQGLFQEAEGLVASGSTDESGIKAKYQEARRLFDHSYDLAAVKRQEALNQLNKAREDIRSVEDEADALEDLEAEGEDQ